MTQWDGIILAELSVNLVTPWICGARSPNKPKEKSTNSQNGKSNDY
jgi:hypothetical protein